MAVPPYSYLRAGKMIAALAVSDSVAGEFFRKYRPTSLKSVVTTSANGLHSPIFNRIMVRPGGLYRRIGETTGYSTLAFTKETVLAARTLVTKHDGTCPDNRTIRTLKRALNICEIPRERIVRLGLRKGVYLAIPSLSNTVESDRLAVGWPQESDIVEYWKEKVLSKSSIRPEIVERVSKFQPRDLLKDLFHDTRINDE